jgi:hypothetical protein
MPNRDMPPSAYVRHSRRGPFGGCCSARAICADARSDSTAKERLEYQERASHSVVRQRMTRHSRSLPKQRAGFEHVTITLSVAVASRPCALRAFASCWWSMLSPGSRTEIFVSITSSSAAGLAALRPAPRPATAAAGGAAAAACLLSNWYRICIRGGGSFACCAYVSAT